MSRLLDSVSQQNNFFFLQLLLNVYNFRWCVLCVAWMIWKAMTFFFAICEDVVEHIINNASILQLQ